MRRLQEQLGYRFNDTALLKQALTHRSVGRNNNERLEFLGDAILGFEVADQLYRRVGDANEGQLSRMRAHLVKRESLARVAIDLSGRPAVVFQAEFPRDSVGELSTEMVRHFFQSLGQALGAAIHVQVDGENTHHMVEAVFKGAGRALRPALERSAGDVPSTKGVL